MTHTIAPPARSTLPVFDRLAVLNIGVAVAAFGIAAWKSSPTRAATVAATCDCMKGSCSDHSPWAGMRGPSAATQM